MRVLIAPGAMSPEPGGAPIAALGLGAREAAEALARGWVRARPDDSLALLPIPDGGPGLAEAIPPSVVESRIVLQAPGPLGQERRAGLLPGQRCGPTSRRRPGRHMDPRCREHGPRPRRSP